MALLLDNLNNHSRFFNRDVHKFDAYRGTKKAFLCHSHADAEYVKGFIQLLKQENINLYVDWQDSAMPQVTNRETALKIQQKIKDLDYFFFLATPNSVKSRWCPWEIGYADGVKSYESIFIIPTQDINGIFYGNEYLDLYQKVDRSNQGVLSFWKPFEQYGRFLSSL